MEFRLYFEIHESGLKSVFKSANKGLDDDNYCDNDVESRRYLHVLSYCILGIRLCLDYEIFFSSSLYCSYGKRTGKVLTNKCKFLTTIIIVFIR